MITQQLKNSHKEKAAFSHIPSQGIFEPRPFVIQAQKANDQKDFKKSLIQTENYGHHFHQIQSQSNQANGSQAIQAKFNWKFWRRGRNAAPQTTAPTPASAPIDHTDLVNSFKPKDKLYGLRDARPQGQVSTKANGSANVIDQLNNQFLGTNFLGGAYKGFPERAKNNPTTAASKEWQTAASYGKPKAGGRPTPEQQNEAQDYQAWLENHPKYSPTKTQVRGEPLSSPFRQWDRTKKSSKAGLEYTAKEKQNKVHFMLDGLNQESIVKKLDHRTGGPEEKLNPVTGDSQQSITASELRSVYRNRKDADFLNNVNFWQGGKQVDAPWATKKGAKLWSQYKPKHEFVPNHLGSVVPTGVSNSDDIHAALDHIK